MERRAGASCLLSLLIVGVAAVVLYRPDPSVSASLSTTTPEPVPAVEPPEPPSSATLLAPEPTPGVPWDGPSAEARPASNSGVGPSAPPPVARRPGVAPRARPPRGGFVTVEGSETLADLARRIYGTEEAVETLWRANRDQLPSPDAPLRPGMPLRTP